jgi:hypothetical protein
LLHDDQSSDRITCSSTSLEQEEERSLSFPPFAFFTFLSISFTFSRFLLVSEL